MSESSYLKGLCGPDRERYYQKLSINTGEKLPDPYGLKESWINDISKLPSITWRDVTEYLIDTPSMYTKESLKAYKSLEAYDYFVCGHVQDVFYHDITVEQEFCFIKSEVLPSQRQAKTSTLYQVWICLNKKDGWILTGNCTCMAGLGSACSHVAALLFKIETAVHLKLNEPDAATSQLCRWKICKKHVEVLPLAKINFKKPKRGNLPKPTQEHREYEQYYSCDNPMSGPDAITLQDYAKLYDVAPRSAHFLSSDLEYVLNSREKTVGQIDSDTDTDTETNENCIPEPITCLFDPSVASMDKDQLSVHATKRFELYCKSYSQQSYDNLREITIKQARSNVWMLHRAGRITSSNCQQIYNVKGTISDSLLGTIMQYRPNFENKYTRYGKKMECVAREYFKIHMKSEHINLKVLETGFHVDQQFPFIGASPDGIVSCDCHGECLLEIKCPYKYQNGFANWQKDPCFPLQDNYTIKEKHQYYFQVQLQMLVCNYSKCFFLIYSPAENGSHMMTTVDRNVSFLAQLKKKLFSVFASDILPEIVSRSKDNSYENDRKLYCLCGRPEFGSMIACDNIQCKVQWFHYSCVSITRAPRGKWFCVTCKPQMKLKNRKVKSYKK